MAPRTRSMPAAGPSATRLPSYGHLHELMRRFQVKDLVNVDVESFMRTLDEFEKLDDHQMEGFTEPDRQHPVYVKFHWGHRHNFGTFSKPGRMGNHHLMVMATFIDELRAIPPSLEGKRVLDIGCWTGGTSLLLSAMGAEVVAIEEVKKYAECTRYLAHAFGLKSIDVRHASLFECVTDEFQDAFDLVLFPGVLHHLSDPKLALRITFNCLKDGGSCLIETLSFEHDAEIVARRALDLASGPAREPWGWNWLLFTPATLMKTMEGVGYTISHPCTVVDGRTFVVGRRDRHSDLWRAGLSVRTIR